MPEARFYGVITSTLMELLVYPAIFYVCRARSIQRAAGILPAVHKSIEE